MDTHLNVLHLRKRQDRLVNLRRQLNQQGICFYSIWEGVDNLENPKKAIQMGHKKIVQMAKNNKQPNCIIAEDDLCFFAQGAWQFFLSQIPNDYDLFCGVIYNGEVDGNNRILNGMSGTMTLYSVHERFYDFFLSQGDDLHVDRNLGQFAYAYAYYVCNPFVAYQLGGYSDNLKRSMSYEPYLEGRNLFGKKV